MNFDQALEYLLRLGHETLAMKFGLENTQRLLEALDQPQREYTKVQITGTNGKGSTAVMLDSICRAAGIKTGLFTSPHLVSITERITINGEMISEDTFAGVTTRISHAAHLLVAHGTLTAAPTFFEHLTAIALETFKEAKVDLAILETGLGGRLDSTTAACAEVIAITPIALDHQEYLGTTLAEIASEKAAVIRPGLDVVFAPQPDIVFEVLRERCLQCNVTPRHATSNIRFIDHDSQGRMRVTFETSESVYESVRVNLPGRHQIINASVAIGLAEVLRTKGFEISDDAIISGLERCAHPGRLEWRTSERNFLFDGAHNVAGAQSLREYLDEFVDAPLTIIFGGMKDKDLEEIAALLFPLATYVNLTEINNPRTATQESLRKLVRHEDYSSRTNIFTNSGDALSAALEQTPAGGVICVTGSLYLIGEVQTSLLNEQRPTYTT